MGPTVTPNSGRRAQRIWLIETVIELLTEVISGIVLGVLMLGVLCARVFGAGPPDRHNVNEEETLSNSEPTTKESNIVHDGLLTNDVSSTPAQARIAAFRHVVSEEAGDYQATAVRPTPPGQILLIGQPGPTPDTPPPAHPSSLYNPARCTSDPPSPASLLPRNLDATLLAVAQADKGVVYDTALPVAKEAQTPGPLKNTDTTGVLGLPDSTRSLWPHDLQTVLQVSGNTGSDPLAAKLDVAPEKASLWGLAQTNIAMTVPRPPVTVAAAAAAGDSPTISSYTGQQPLSADDLFDKHGDVGGGVGDGIATPVAAGAPCFGFVSPGLTAADGEACSPAAVVPLPPKGVACPDEVETVWRRSALVASDKGLDLSPEVDAEERSDRIKGGLEFPSTEPLEACPTGESQAAGASEPALCDPQVQVPRPATDSASVIRSDALPHGAPGPRFRSSTVSTTSRLKPARPAFSPVSAAPGQAVNPKAASVAPPPGTPGLRRPSSATTRSVGAAPALSQRSVFPEGAAVAASPRSGSKSLIGTKPTPASSRWAGPSGAGGSKDGLASPPAGRSAFRPLRSDGDAGGLSSARSYAAPTAASKARRSLTAASNGLAGPGVASTGIPLEPESQGRLLPHKAGPLSTETAAAASAGGGGNVATPRRGSRLPTGAPHIG